ncbi:MAG: glycosyl hydrolase 115 family protein [Bacteroidales bacterium]|nr:glycosyl hydrolase 115 family protein [Bacteroides sp.]MCM1198472.1 glycosyl hydrolase 115 family protein [Clostridium sp.]MCM1502398.1 glycosyl hydrolase 115 family protein [Bacteroidales bacterium]
MASGLLYVLTLSFLCLTLEAEDVKVLDRKGRAPSVFCLASRDRRPVIYVDENDAIAVKKSAELLAADIEAVTGIHAGVVNALGKSRSYVIAGTVDGCGLVRSLAESGKIDLEPIRGGWEQFCIKTVKNPFPGVQEALVVAGSDRRGVAYGLFTISEKIGVNPWYWWADVPVKRHSELYVDAKGYYSEEPSVKYRGIFLNDEDWGLAPWASRNYEKELGNIGPRTYSRICELLLRLKANMLAPAMHPVSAPFHSIPENRAVADSFAIVMTSTHCEPLLLNTASEWDSRTMGPWNYDANKEGINRVLTERVRETAMYENVYPLALRGLHDAVMADGIPMKDKVRMLSEALNDQRTIISANVDAPLEDVPQAFTPYKEVLEIYSSGLELPDDVTIVWPDDNYGYMKRLSGTREQGRSGRSGVYYHVSYLGVPHSYLWFSTTHPALMYEELRKAYDTGADRFWLLNCGDLKGSEMQVSFFLSMGYGIGRFTQDNAVDYPAEWLGGIFGEELHEELDSCYREFLSLAFTRKPEYMGWGYHWNHYGNGCEQLTDTGFSFLNYGEAQERLDSYSRLGDFARRTYGSLPQEMRPAFCQLVWYPFRGAELMNRMTLGAQKNRMYARQGRLSANAVADEVRACHDSLELITEEYNSILGGKWRHMMSLRQNYDHTSSYYKLPELCSVEASGKASLAVQVEGEDVSGVRSFKALPAFDCYLRPVHWMDVYSTGDGVAGWSAEPLSDWILLSQYSGTTAFDSRIDVSIDWSKVPSGSEVLGEITLRGAGEETRVLVSVFNPEFPSREQLEGMYVQSNGVVSIPAALFHRITGKGQVEIRPVPGLGIDGDALQLGNPVAPLQNYRSGDTPSVEYDFWCFDSGQVDVYTYVLPVFPLNIDRDFKLPENTNVDTKYSVQIDGGAISTPTSSHVEYTQLWYESVLRNSVVNKSTMNISSPGKHTLRIRTGDPGMVIQKIVVDFGGMKHSYLGPKSTYIEK